MEALKLAMFGGITWPVWLAGMVWSFVGAGFIKAVFFNKTSAEKIPFTQALKFWLNDNILDMVKVIFLSLCFLRAGTWGFGIIEWTFNITLPEIDDLVVGLMFVSALFQVVTHKGRKPLIWKVYEQMKASNGKN